MPTVDIIMSKDSEEEKAAAQPSFEYLTIPQDAEEYSDHSAQDYLTKSGYVMRVRTLINRHGFGNYHPLTNLVMKAPHPPRQQFMKPAPIYLCSYT